MRLLLSAPFLFCAAVGTVSAQEIERLGVGQFTCTAREANDSVVNVLCTHSPKSVSYRGLLVREGETFSGDLTCVEQGKVGCEEMRVFFGAKAGRYPQRGDVMDCMIRTSGHSWWCFSR